jgi:transposase
MSQPSCPGCAQRDALIATLLQRIADLEREVHDLKQRLGLNASNSSLPPSANPPAAPPLVVKKPTGRKTGGQPGHPGHQRLRLPAARVQHVIALVPSQCEACQAPLPQQPSAADPEPVWHQFAELPRVSAVVTEFQGHARTCPGCGHVTRESIPAAIRAHAFGPRLAAVLSYLSGSHYVSQRGLCQDEDEGFQAAGIGFARDLIEKGYRGQIPSAPPRTTTTRRAVEMQKGRVYQYADNSHR